MRRFARSCLRWLAAATRPVGVPFLLVALKLFVFFLLATAASAQADPGALTDAALADTFVAGHVDVAGQRYPYRLLEPLRSQRATAVPLLVFLHGAGERGTDNLRQLTWLPKLLAEPERRARTPCYLLAVQCPEDEQWVDVPWGEAKPTALAQRPTRSLRAVQLAMARVLARPGVDHARVYVTGLSMGGYGAWDLVARRPEQFAGCVPVCGGGDPNAVRRMLGLPVQIWHGTDDLTVPVVRARLMAEQYVAYGLSVDFRELRGVGHDVWRQAYQQGNAIEWLFAQDQRQQRRGAHAELAIVPQPKQQLVGTGTFRLRRGVRVVTDESLRRLVSYFLDALELDAADRPGLVGRTKPVTGDISAHIVADQEQPWLLQIGEIVRITAQDARAMRAALAVLFQAMHTRPDGAIPYGKLWPAQRQVDATVSLAKPTTRWQRAALRQLLIECWLGSVQRVCFEGGLEDHATARAGREFTVLSRRLGMDLVDRAEPPIGIERTVSAVSGESIRAVFRKPGQARQTYVLISAAAPAEMLRHTSVLLPASLERAASANGPLHVGSFVARLAARGR